MLDYELKINSLQGNYLITGVTGFLGGLITKQLMQSKDYAEGKMHIYGIVRNCEKADAQFAKADSHYLSFLKADICNYDSLKDVEEKRIDYIIHCAASTKSSYMISNPVETADGIVLGTRNMLELARKLNVKSMVYISSMEVYGQVYNVVNEENTMTIREMAELVANKIADGKIQVKIEEEDNMRTGYAPETQLKMSGQKMYDLGWRPKKDLVQMYRYIGIGKEWEKC